MRPAIIVIIVYPSKLRVTVWRTPRCLILCDRLLSPLSVMLGHLIIRVNETSQSCHYSLHSKVESDGMESCKVSKTLQWTFESSVSNVFTAIDKNK